MRTGTSGGHRIWQKLIGIFFIIAGVNHFINPGFYLPLIPPFIPVPETVNIASGILEIAGGMGFLLPRLRKPAAPLLLVLLILFIPSHVHFIREGSCIKGVLCVPGWIGWARLVLIHPLIIWAVIHFGRTTQNG